MSNLIKISLSQAARALRVGFIADLPVALWGPVGVGKSSVVRQSVPKGWKLYDVRLSDKEASDLSGIPMPNTKTSRVEYMMTNLLPVDCDEKCVVLFDEVDRTADMSVQNTMLQWTLDRCANGHPLSKNARIVLAGNGATDIGTIPLSSAAAGRMCHLYIEAHDQPAIEAWMGWAKSSDVTAHLQSFAKYRSDVWVRNGATVAELENLAHPHARSWEMADRLYRATKQASFDTSDIMLPLLAGCVGKTEAIELLGWYKLCESAPTLEEIVVQPQACRLPDQLGVYFALGLTMARTVKGANGKELPKVDAFARYISRWPQEQAAFAFSHLLEAEPRTATSKAYLSWKQSR